MRWFNLISILYLYLLKLFYTFLTNDNLTLKYVKVNGDKIKLGTRRIKELLCTKSELKSELLKLMDKGGLAVVFSGATLITA
jgi:sRNA-binding carbon storage regulator CsrA